MLLAVNMPEHEPQVGQAERSISPSSSSLTLASLDAIIESMRSSLRTSGLPSRSCVPTILPASIGPPETKMVGMLRRIAAISMPGRDLVAVRDADQRVGAVRVHHVLDAVGDEVAARQRVQHPAVAHRDAVVDGDGVELDAPAAGGVDDLLHALPDVVQVHVARDELREAVGDGDDRLLEVGVLHPGGAPERARAGHVAALRSRCGCGIRERS